MATSYRFKLIRKELHSCSGGMDLIMRALDPPIAIPCSQRQEVLSRLGHYCIGCHGVDFPRGRAPVATCVLFAVVGAYRIARSSTLRCVLVNEVVHHPA